MVHDHAAHEQTPEQLEVQFEQLSLLESEFEDAESEVSKWERISRDIISR
jgi:hypothetical protein